MEKGCETLGTLRPWMCGRLWQVHVRIVECNWDATFWLATPIPATNGGKSGRYRRINHGPNWPFTPSEQTSLNRANHQLRGRKFSHWRDKRLSRLDKAPSMCTVKPNESLATFIERFVSPAQGYLNVASADWTSTESKKMYMTLLRYTNLSQEPFSSVKANLVNRTKTKASQTKHSISIDISRIDTITDLFSTLTSIKIFLELATAAKESISCL